MARLGQWVKDDLLRLLLLNIFLQAWEIWLDEECLISRTHGAMVKFSGLLELDIKRCEAEARERWVKLKESVSKSEAAGFRSTSDKNSRVVGWR